MSDLLSKISKLKMANVLNEAPDYLNDKPAVMRNKYKLRKLLVKRIKKDKPGYGIFTMCIDKIENRKLSDYFTPLGQPLIIIKVDKSGIYFLREKRHDKIRGVMYADWDDLYLNMSARVYRVYDQETRSRMKIILPDEDFSADPYIDALLKVDKEYEMFYETPSNALINFIYENVLYSWVKV